MNVIHSEKALMLHILYLLVFTVYFLNFSNTGTFKAQPLNDFDAGTKNQECFLKIDLNPLCFYIISYNYLPLLTVMFKVVESEIPLHQDGFQL